ncbi:MAG: ABC transporter substrate binding protein [Spirochaetota bacterium]
MIRRNAIPGRLLARASLFVSVIFLALGACSSEPRRIVIVNPARHGERIVRGVIDRLESTLGEEGRRFHIVDSGRIPNLDELEAFVRMQLDEPPVMVVAMTDEAVRIVERYRDVSVSDLVYWAHSHPADLAESLGYGDQLPNASGVALGLSPTSAEDVRLDYLLELVPDARRVLVVHNPDDQDAVRGMSSLRRVARDHGVDLLEAPVRTSADAVSHLPLIPEVDAVHLTPDRAIGVNALKYYEAARMHRRPLSAPNTSSVVEGALVSYSFSESSVSELLVRVITSVLVDGLSPDDVPVGLPEFDLAYNRRVAREIGLEAPQVFLEQVDVMVD